LRRWLRWDVLTAGYQIRGLTCMEIDDIRDIIVRLTQSFGETSMEIPLGIYTNTHVWCLGSIACMKVLSLSFATCMELSGVKHCSRMEVHVCGSVTSVEAMFLANDFFSGFCTTCVGVGFLGRHNHRRVHSCVEVASVEVARVEVARVEVA
jgi:hypothetical protein